MEWIREEEAIELVEGGHKTKNDWQQSGNDPQTASQGKSG